MAEPLCSDLIQKILSLKCLLFDVEGILTLQHRSFQPPFITDLFYQDDRNALVDMIHRDFIIGVISSGETKLLRKNLQDMKIPFIYLGIQNKLIPFEEMQRALHLNLSQFAHMGDGEKDLPLFERVGFSISVPNAPIAIQKKASYCTTREGGWGAVAEACALIAHYQRSYH